MSVDEIRGGFKLNVKADVSGVVDKQLQARINDLTNSLVNLNKAQQDIASGWDLDKYWRTQAASIDGVSEAYERFTQQTSKNNASELVKSFNAFIAQGGEIEGLFAKYGDDLEKFVKQARAMVPDVSRIFAVESLRGAYKAFDELRSVGSDMSDVFAKLGAGDTSEMQRNIDSLTQQVVRYKNEVVMLQDELERVGNSTGFAQLESQLERLKGRMRDEFNTYLDSAGLGDARDWGTFDSYFQSIEEGSMTAHEAIARLKYEFDYLLRDQGGAASATGLEDYITRLEAQMSVLETVVQRLATIGDGAQAQGGAVAQMGDLQPVLENLRSITTTGEEAGESARTASEQILRLVTSLTELSGASEDKLKGVYNIMMSLQGMGKISGSSSALTNIVAAMDSLSRLPNLAQLGSLSIIDLKGFNGLSVKKSSLANLATYLPQISTANVGNIRALSEIDFTNLNNLKVSKASVRNLADLAQVYDTVEQLRQRIDAAGIADIGETGDIIPDVDTTDVAAEAAANIEQLAEAHRDAGQAAEEHAQAEVEYAAAETDAASAVGDQPAVHEETAAAAREHADAMREVAEADAAAAENVREAVGETDNAAAKLKSVNSELNNIMSLAGKGLNGLASNSEKYGDTEQVDALRSRVAELGNEIALVRTGQKEATAEAMSGYRAEANAIQETIVEITRARSAQDEAKRSAAEAVREMNSISNLASKGTSGLTSNKYDSAEVDAVLARIKALNDAMDEYRNGDKVATPEVLSRFRAEAAAIQEVITELKRMATAAAEAEAASRKAASVETQATNLKNQIAAYISNNSKAYQLYGKSLESLMDKLSSGNVGAEQLQAIRTEFGRIKIAADEAGVSGKTFYQTMQEGWKRFGGWSLVTKSFTQIVRLARETVNAVKEIDSAMTELRKVTDLTAAGYDRFYQKAVNVATAIGASVSDTINATADFARLGYNTEDAMALAEAGLVYKNVGDGIDSIGQATESVISTLKAFGLESQNAMQIIDEFNEVGKLLPMPVVTRCLAECYIGQSSVWCLCA